MNRILRNSLNIAKILFTSYCTYDGIFCWFVDKHERCKSFSCWSILRGEAYSEETIERLKWNLIFMFHSMLVLWCLSEMTGSRGHGLHRNSVHGKTGASSLEPLNHWTDFNHIWQKFSQRDLAQQLHDFGYFDGQY